VKKADFSVYLNGLGAVEPYQTVLIRSRVDGAIVKIAFKQGQMVKQGDVLAQVDPRPYQAALDQALAKKTQDEATLRDARLNLQRYADLANNDSVSRQTYDTQQAMVRSTDSADQRRPGDHRQRPDAIRLYDNSFSSTGKTGFRQSTPATSSTPSTRRASSRLSNCNRSQSCSPRLRRTCRRSTRRLRPASRR